MSDAESKEISDELEQSLIDIHLPCDSGDSPEETNEKHSSPIENPAKRPRNNENENIQDKSKFSKLLGDTFESESVPPPRLVLVDKIK